jgi:hypothetical protein
MRLLFVFAQCFLTGALLMAQGQPTPDGSIQARNKAVAVRVFDEIFNQGKFQVADEIYAPDFQNHGLHRSVDLKTDQEAERPGNGRGRGQGGRAMDISRNPHWLRL